jgi:hypothetical protein
MDSSLSFASSASTISRTAVGMSQPPCTSLAGRPLGSIILKDDTYLLGDNNEVIPIPAGTVAIPMDDSDDDQSISAAVDSSKSCSDTTPAATLLDIEKAEEIVATSASEAHEETLVSVVPPLTSGEMNVEDKLDKAEALVVSELPLDLPCTGSESIDVLTSVNPSMSISDLYVQEEEEVVMDETVAVAEVVSTPAAAPKEQRKKMEFETVTSTCHVLPSHESKKGGQKKNAKGQSVIETQKSPLKLAQEAAASKAEPPRSPSPPQEKLMIKRDRGGGAKLAQQDTVTIASQSVMAAVPSAVSASGRPQRNTPRRSTYEMLHGTDLKPVVRRPTSDHEAEMNSVHHRQQSVKKQKTGAALKPAEDERSTALMESKLASEVHSRARGRPRRQSATSGSDFSVVGLSSSETASVATLPSPSSSSVVASALEKIIVPAVGDTKTDTLDTESSMLGISAAPQANYDESGLADSEMTVKPQLDEVVVDETGGKKDEERHIDVTGEVTMVKAPSSVVSTETKTEDEETVVKLEGAACLEAVVDDADGAKTSKKRGRPSRTVPVSGDNEKVEDGCGDRQQPLLTADESSAKRRKKKPDSETKQPSKVSMGPKLTSGVSGKAVLENNTTAVCKGPGFPYSSFTGGSLPGGLDTADDTEPVEPGEQSYRTNESDERRAVERDERVKFCSHSAGDTTNWMLQKIKELEVEVEDLQEKLTETKRREKTLEDANKPSRLWQIVLAEVRSAAQEEEGEAHEKLVNARLSQKLRKLDRELDDRVSALKVREGRVARRERRVQQRERELEQRQKLLATHPNAELADGTAAVITTSAKEPLSGSLNPVPRSGRATLLNKELNLEFREHLLAQRQSFIEDEQKKLVAKDRELKSREQALVSADLKTLTSFSTPTKAVEPPCATTDKHLNGKVVAEFSDDDSDGDGFGQQCSLNSLSYIGGSAAMSTVATTSSRQQFLLGDFESDDDKDDDDDTKPLSQVSAATKSLVASGMDLSETLSEVEPSTMEMTPSFASDLKRKRQLDGLDTDSDCEVVIANKLTLHTS